MALIRLKAELARQLVNVRGEDLHSRTTKSNPFKLYLRGHTTRQGEVGERTRFLRSYLSQAKISSG